MNNYNDTTACPSTSASRARDLCSAKTLVKTNCYIENEKTRNRSPEEIDEFRKEHHIVIEDDADAIPKPILFVTEIKSSDHCISWAQMEWKTQLSPITAQCLPVIMKGGNLVAIGGGRTEIAGKRRLETCIFPIIPHLQAQMDIGKEEGPVVIFLLDSTQNQFTRILADYLHGTDFKCKFKSSESRGSHILVTDVPHLLEAIQHGHTDLKRCTYLVLNDCACFVKTRSKAEPLEQIFKMIRPDCQVQFWSASMTKPLDSFLKSLTGRPGEYIHINFNMDYREMEKVHDFKIAKDSKQKLHIFQEFITQNLVKEANILVVTSTEQSMNIAETILKEIGEPTFHSGQQFDFQNPKIRMLIAEGIEIVLANENYILNNRLESDTVIFFDFPKRFREFKCLQPNTRIANCFAILTTEEKTLAVNFVGNLFALNISIPKKLLDFAQKESNEKFLFSKFKCKKVSEVKNNVKINVMVLPNNNKRKAMLELVKKFEKEILILYTNGDIKHNAVKYFENKWKNRSFVFIDAYNKPKQWRLLNQFTKGKHNIIMCPYEVAHKCKVKLLARHVIHASFPTNFSQYPTSLDFASESVHTLVAAKERSHAKYLIKLLGRYNQEVPNALKEMAGESNVYKLLDVYNYYTEHRNTSTQRMQDVEKYREEHNIVVKGFTPKPIQSFEECSLPRHFVRMIFDFQSDLKPSDVPAQCLPVILNGRALVAIVNTEFDKMFTYILPALIHIYKRSEKGAVNAPIAVIVVFQHEVAENIRLLAAKIIRGIMFERTVPAPAVCCNENARNDIQTNNELLVATPECFWDMVIKRQISLKRCSYFVIDQANEMVAQKQLQPVISILKNLNPAVIQIWCKEWCSQLAKIANQFMRSKVMIAFNLQYPIDFDPKPVISIRQEVCVCNPSDKPNTFLSLLERFSSVLTKIIIFVRSIESGRFLCAVLNTMNSVNLQAVSITEEFQEATVERYLSGLANVVVATENEIAYTKFNDFDIVVNYECPRNFNVYKRRLDLAKELVISFVGCNERKIAKELLQFLQDCNEIVPPNLMAMVPKPFDNDDALLPEPTTDFSKNKTKLSKRKTQVGSRLFQNDVHEGNHSELENCSRSSTSSQYESPSNNSNRNVVRDFHASGSSRASRGSHYRFQREADAGDFDSDRYQEWEERDSRGRSRSPCRSQRYNDRSSRKCSHNEDVRSYPDNIEINNLYGISYDERNFEVEHRHFEDYNGPELIEEQSRPLSRASRYEVSSERYAPEPVREQEVSHRSIDSGHGYHREQSRNFYNTSPTRRQMSPFDQPEYGYPRQERSYREFNEERRLPQVEQRFSEERHENVSYENVYNERRDERSRTPNQRHYSRSLSRRHSVERYEDDRLSDRYHEQPDDRYYRRSVERHEFMHVNRSRQDEQRDWEQERAGTQFMQERRGTRGDGRHSENRSRSRSRSRSMSTRIFNRSGSKGDGDRYVNYPDEEDNIRRGDYRGRVGNHRERGAARGRAPAPARGRGGRHFDDKHRDEEDDYDIVPQRGGNRGIVKRGRGRGAPLPKPKNSLNPFKV